VRIELDSNAGLNAIAGGLIVVVAQVPAGGTKGRSTSRVTMHYKCEPVGTVCGSSGKAELKGGRKNGVRSNAKWNRNEGTAGLADIRRRKSKRVPLIDQNRVTVQLQVGESDRLGAGSPQHR
jgi:hypothetical protein